jgi:hypothetical protein
MNNKFIKKSANILAISSIYSVFFGILETSLRQFDIKILKKENLHNYTTLHQFFLTFAWSPIFFYHKKIKNKYVKYLLYPVNIYLCEIIGGNILLYVFDFRAWHYKDKFTLFNGMITLSYYPLWMFLGYVETKIYKKYIKKILL